MNSKTVSTPSTTLAQQSQAFLDYVLDWLEHIPALSAGQLFEQPERCALISVDVIKGFCNFGPLASPRVGAIVPAVVKLMETAWQHGMHHILLPQDTHEPDAVEFSAWPPHCVRGTAESEAVDEIRALPFYDQMLTMPKNSINSGENTALNQWMADHREVDTYIIVGDCTDLCVYQLAMHLRTDANARQLQRRVIVPVSGVDTYDYSLDLAQTQGGMPHPAELIHVVFLYHMALNGVEVVSEIA